MTQLLETIPSSTIEKALLLLPGTSEVIPILGAQIKQVSLDEFDQLIDFDRRVMLDRIDIPQELLPPPLTLGELASGLAGGDWIQRVKEQEIWAGYAWAKFRENDAYLESIAVDPAYQGRGLGRFLINSFHAEARTRGYERATLSVALPNELGFRAFIRQGYEIVRYAENYLGPGIDRLIMACDLTNPAPTTSLSLQRMPA